MFLRIRGVSSDEKSRPHLFFLLRFFKMGHSVRNAQHVGARMLLTPRDGGGCVRR